MVGVGSTVKRTYVNASIHGKYYVGGFSGQSTNVYNSLSNSYIKGEGFIAGSVSDLGYDTYTENTIILGTLDAKDYKQEAFIHLIDTYHNKNNLFLGNINQLDKTSLFNRSPVYVLDQSIVLEASIENTGSLIYLTLDQLKTKAFYTSNHFDETIWDLNVIEEGYLPIIKGIKMEYIYIKDLLNS